MSKITKRVVPLILAVVLCLSMAVPAFAATLAVNEVAAFPAQSQGNSNGYVGVIQRYMYLYNNTTHQYIVNSGGVDGSFGQGTYNAVVAYQAAKGFTTDGVFGSQSWPELASTISLYNNNTFRYDGAYYHQLKPLMHVTNLSAGYVNSTTKWYYYYNDSSYSTTAFRTA